MTSHLVVSTECPLCGAPLDFTEGSNAVQCLHCQSNLLVTGRKQLLSYYVAPKIDAHRAMSRLTAAQLQRDTVFQFVKSQLYFIPYYRLTGHDFRWELAPEKPQVQRSTAPLLTPMGAGGASGWENSSLDLSSFVEGAGNLIGKLFGVTVRTGHGSHEDTAPMAIQENPSRHRARLSSRENSPPTARAPGGNGHHSLRVFNQYCSAERSRIRLGGNSSTGGSRIVFMNKIQV